MITAWLAHGKSDSQSSENNLSLLNMADNINLHFSSSFLDMGWQRVGKKAALWCSG